MNTVISNHSSKDEPTRTRGLFCLDVLSNSSSVNVTLGIAKQSMTLVGYRVEMSSAATALAAKVAYVDIPFLSSNQLVDNNINFSLLLLPLDNATVTLRDGLDFPIHMSNNIPQYFNVSVRDKTGALLANLVSMTLIFRTEFSNIN